MADLLNISVYILLTYAGFKMLKFIGVDIKAFFSPKIDHNIYMSQLLQEPINLDKNIISSRIEGKESYKMNFNDKLLRDFIKHKPVAYKEDKQDKDFIKNIFDLI